MTTSTRLAKHQEHYESVERLFDDTFSRVEGLVTPHLEQYTQAGLPFLMLAGAELHFEAGEERDKLSVVLGVNLRANPEKVDTYHLSLLAASGTISGFLFPLIKDYDPSRYQKYKCEEGIRNAGLVADVLANKRTILMGLTLWPRRAGAPSLAAVQGAST